jgi:hypothetical protein
MNVLYLGLDNPVSVAVSGYDAEALRVETDKGKILGENGQYIVRPVRPGTLTIFVHAGDELVSQTQFRVKTVPNPKGMIGDLAGGWATKEDLLKAGNLSVNLHNFDYDMSWEVVSFVMSASVPSSNVVREEISRSENFSELQIDLIKSMSKHQKLMVEQIKVKGPDGTIRQIAPLVFTME